MTELRNQKNQNKRKTLPFAKGKFGKYLLYRNENPPTDLNNDLVHRKIEESQLFLEAAHACYARLRDVETKENRG